MKKWMAILCLSTLVLSVGCNSEATQKSEVENESTQKIEETVVPETTKTDEVGDSKETSGALEKQVTVVELSTDATLLENLNLVNSYETDLNKDGTNEVIEMYSSADIDTQGEVVYDDGQTWALIVRTDEGFYPLVSPIYVQMGGIHYTLFEDYNDELLHVLVSNESGANILVEDFVYSLDTQSFNKTIIYNADNINVLNKW